MDHLDFVLQNHPRPATHYDPVHAASSQPWAPQPPVPASSSSSFDPWQPLGSPSVPQTFPHPLLQPPHFPDTTQLAQNNAGLPPPAAAFQSGSGPDAVGSGYSSRYTSQPAHRFAHNHSLPPPPLPPAAAVATTAHSHSSRHHNPMMDDASANQASGGRALSFQPAMDLTMTPHGAAPEPNSLSRMPSSSSASPWSEMLANGIYQQHRVPLPPPSPSQPPSSSFANVPSPRRGHHSTPSSSSRPFRELQPSILRPSPSGASTSRRSHPRARRSMSARFMATEAAREDDEDFTRQYFWEQLMQTTGRSGLPLDPQAVDDAFVRQIQVVRGSLTNKMVASKSTLRTLESVPIEELSEAERTCVICYNDYGVNSPEGINEAPLRLPKCKHVFGDHCIKKWLEDSDSCPYCRDKLHSEPKPQGSARMFMNMMRWRGGPPPSGISTDTPLGRATSSSSASSSGSASRQHPAPAPAPVSTGRRSPPDDEGEQQRRTRPRHNHAGTRESGSSRASGSRPTRPPLGTAAVAATAAIAAAAVTDGNGSLGPLPHPRDVPQRPEWTTNTEGVMFGQPRMSNVPRWTGRPHALPSLSPSTVNFPSQGVSLDGVGGASIQQTRQSGREDASTLRLLPNPVQSPGGVSLAGHSMGDDSTPAGVRLGGPAATDSPVPTEHDARSRVW